jgi:uncharacterized damage-inducible protein DinB
MKKTLLLLTLVVPAFAQNPLSADVKSVYETVRRNVLGSAEKMSEENYSFKPSPDVRSFGQLLGHIADAQYLFCGGVKGERKQMGVEKSTTAKADMIKALNEAFAYCDDVYGSMTDAQGAEVVKFFNRDRPKLGVLGFNNAHTWEHYGNLVTYLRIKGIVPPSSERR